MSQCNLVKLGPCQLVSTPCSRQLLVLRQWLLFGMQPPRPYAVFPGLDSHVRVRLLIKPITNGINCPWASTYYLSFHYRNTQRSFNEFAALCMHDITGDGGSATDACVGLDEVAG